MKRAAVSALSAVFLVASLQARVTSIDIQKKSVVADGNAFGAAGAYTRLSGTVRFSVDPQDPHNRNIADIELAPVNANGLVEFSADLCILQPTDLSKGNGTVLFEVVNRGKKGLLATFNRARTSNDPLTAEDLGDGVLLKAGYTLVWVGWQHDVPTANGNMHLYAPAGGGAKGLVRSEYTPDRAVSMIPLGDSGHVAYPVAPGGKVSVTVRNEIFGPRTEVPSSTWTLNPTGTSILLSTATTPGQIYEVVYQSANPPVAGLGLAAIRDLIAHLKRQHRYAIGFGVSQSAMVLRGLLYEGFNQDEEGKMVFDGIFAHVAGARRSTFQRFVQASRTAGPLRNASLSTTEQFPYSDLDQVDPVTQKRDGLLRAAMASKQVPKIIYTNSAYEYWGSAASLLHTTPDGKNDAAVPNTSRIYMYAGGQHGPAQFPPQRGAGQNLPNFNDYRWSLRALLMRLQRWIENDEAPPASVYPSFKAGTLTSPQQYRFPSIPGVNRPKVIHIPYHLDFGPEYASKGVIANEPPKPGGHYEPLVPQADSTGNDRGGVSMPQVSCSLGTFTGWNLRNASVGNTQYLLGQNGSYIPFAWTKLERESNGDPRKSVEEAFNGLDEYLACIQKRTAELVEGGFLLQSDSEPVKQAAVRHWNWRSEQAKPVNRNSR